MNKEEERQQVAFVGWFRLQFPAWHSLLTLGSFGENVGKLRMHRLKQMGLTPGYPDLVLYYPKWVGETLVPALFIEMKTKKGRLSVEQVQIHHILKSQNYEVHVARGWEEAKEIITNYIRN